MKTEQENELQELTTEELMQTEGGRSLWFEVGFGVGYAAGWLWDQTSTMRAFGGTA